MGATLIQCIHFFFFLVKRNLPHTSATDTHVHTSTEPDLVTVSQVEWWWWWWFRVHCGLVTQHGDRGAPMCEPAHGAQAAMVEHEQAKCLKEMPHPKATFH